MLDPRPAGVPHPVWMITPARPLVAVAPGSPAPLSGLCHASGREYDRRQVLVGRREELRRIGGLLAAVKRGRSCALVLVGEPGIGKSALLEETVRRARGVRVVRASGVESEGKLPYAGLLTLTRPVAGLVPSLPEPQAHALTAALALGSAPPADPLAVCAATLGLLAAAAEDEPVLAVVDDAQWLDAESAQAIGFAARRLADEGVAILLALREGEESAFSPAGLDQLVVRGLAPDEASELLSGRIATSAAQRLAELTIGNPLALLELAEDLSDAQGTGLDPIAEPLPVGEALERAFGRRLNQLSESARAAVVVAAAAGSRDDVATLERAWSRLGARPDELATRSGRESSRSRPAACASGIRSSAPWRTGRRLRRTVERRMRRWRPRSTVTPSRTNAPGTSLSRRQAPMKRRRPRSRRPAAEPRDAAGAPRSGRSSAQRR